jgi:hypothetical protein
MLQSEDCNGESDLDRHIASLVACHCDEWARTIGPKDASPQFRADVSEAILSCIQMLDPANRERRSKIRKKLQRVNREATAAADSLLKLEGAIQDVTPQYRKLLDDWDWDQECQPGKLDLHLILARAGWVRAIGERSWAMAQIIDKGGPRAMISFRALVSGLGLSFKHATSDEAKVTWNEHRGRYGGRFLKLVEAVLKKIAPISTQFSQTIPLKYPDTPHKRGRYIYDMTRRGSKKETPPRTSK